MGQSRTLSRIIVTLSSIVYGVLDTGIEYAHVVIAGGHRLETFDFALPVPGPAFVGTNIRAEETHSGRKIEDLGLASFRAVFAKLPCCTTGADGTRDGDPLNLVIVEGVGAVPLSAPRPNLTGDPYYTDGLRAVIFLSDQTIQLENAERLPWEVPQQAAEPR